VLDLHVVTAARPYERTILKAERTRSECAQHPPPKKAKLVLHLHVVTAARPYILKAEVDALGCMSWYFMSISAGDRFKREAVVTYLDRPQ
jgi:hypothetical protein